MKKKNLEISEKVISRLPKYYRLLGELSAGGVVKISSKEISELLGFSASQVRQDLSNFGDFGQQGYGYDTKNLLEAIRKILGLTREFSMIIVGVGRIGGALAGYQGFAAEGFVVKALFDKEADEARGIRGMATLEEYIKDNPTDIAIIAVDKHEAKKVAKRLYTAGIKTLWNFAPTDLFINGAVIENINMSESLFKLVYKASI